MNDVQPTLIFLQTNWKSTGKAIPPDLQISTNNSRKQATMRKGSNFRKLS